VNGIACSLQNCLSFKCNTTLLLLPVQNIPLSGKN
jgi:hypothetical protein